MAYNKIIFKTGEVALDLTQDTVAPDTLLEGVTAHDQNGELITGTAKEYVEPVLQETTVTPTQSIQIISPDGGYDGFGKVIINAIPATYVQPSGDLAITENNKTYDITNYKTATVNVAGAGGGTYTGHTLTLVNTGSESTTWSYQVIQNGNIHKKYTKASDMVLDNVMYFKLTTAIDWGTSNENDSLYCEYSESDLLNGVVLTDDLTVEVYSIPCFIKGTQIMLADGSTKSCEDITYDDELLVWDFYEGKFASAKPTWIKVKQVASQYNKVTFDNGTEIGFVGPADLGYHRIFNKEAGKFTYTGSPDTPNGTTTFTSDGGWTKVVNQEIIKEPVNFYNIITDKHYNLFANGILTSCRLSNKYAIEDMKYVGDLLISKEAEEAYFKRIDSLKV